MDPISAIVSGVGSIYGSAISAYAQKKTNEANIKAQKQINQQNIDFQKAENDIMRAREDTAHQREVEDLKAAGLSPLAALGGASSQAGSVVSQVAPQADATGFLQAGQLASQGFQQAGNLLSEIMKEDRQDVRQSKQLEADRQNLVFKLGVETDNLKKQIESNEYLKDSELGQDLIKFTQSQETLNKQIDLDFQVKTFSLAQDVYKQKKELLHDTYGVTMFNDKYTDKEECEAAYQAWYDGLTKRINSRLGEFVSSYSESFSRGTSEGSSYSGGATFGSSSVGPAVGGSLSQSKSESLSRSSFKSESYDLQKLIHSVTAEYCRENGGAPMLSVRALAKSYRH